MNRNHLYTIKLAVIIVAVLISIFCLNVTCSNAEKSASSNVQMVLYKSRDLPLITLKANEAELTSVKVKIKEKENVEKLLESNGIYVDGESIGYLYKLNPNIDEKTIHNRRELILPKVVGGKSLTNAIKEGYLVQLTFDVELKQQFKGILKELEKIHKEIQSLNLNSMVKPAGEEGISSAVKYIINQLNNFNEVIEVRKQIIDTETLRYIIGEAQLLKNILSESINKNYKLSDKNISTIQLIEEDIKAKSIILYEAMGSGEIPPKPKRVLLIVKTLKKGIEIHNLRVYYAAKALALLERKDYYKVCYFSLDKNSSPAKGEIPREGNHSIWVVDHNFSRLTDPIPIEVMDRDIIDMSVDLKEE